MATVTFISTTSQISTMLSTLQDLPTSPPSLYIDLEGTQLSRNGTISLLTLYAPPLNTIYLIDVHNLGATTFSTLATPESDTTLKSLLESPSIPKVFFDVRNDSDALFAHYAIDLKCITDLQLMELATTTRRNRTYVNGLAACIERDSGISSAQRDHARAVKDAGRKLFAPEKGGSYDVFNERPLQPMVQEYCVVDVLHMPKLWEVYKKRMSAFWEVMVREAGEERVRESQGSGYRADDGGKRLGCWSVRVVGEARGRWEKGVRSGLCG